MKFPYGPAGLAVTILFSGAAGAAQDREPRHCDSLISVIETAIQGIVDGDHSNRVRVALEAHKRLGCDPMALLEALKIQRPKSASKKKE